VNAIFKKFHKNLFDKVKYACYNNHWDYRIVFQFHFIAINNFVFVFEQMGNHNLVFHSIITISLRLKIKVCFLKFFPSILSTQFFNIKTIQNSKFVVEKHFYKWQ